MLNYSNIALETVEMGLGSFCYDPVPAGSSYHYSHGVTAAGLKYLVRQEKLTSPVDGDFIDFYVTIYPQVKEIECTCPSHRAEKIMCAHIAEVLFYYMFDTLDPQNRPGGPEVGKMSRRMREALAARGVAEASAAPQPEIIGIAEAIVAAAWQGRARATLKHADNLIARFDLF